MGIHVQDLIWFRSYLRMPKKQASRPSTKPPVGQSFVVVGFAFSPGIFDKHEAKGNTAPD